MSDLASRNFTRILLIKPSSPGDIIHALPVLHGLRRRYPSAHIAWLVATPFVDLLAAEEAIDEIIPFDRKRYGRIGRSWRVTREFIGFIRMLRSHRFDMVIDLQGLFRSGFLSFVSGASTRIGFHASREMARLFYTCKIAPGHVERHAAEKNFDVAHLLGFDDGAMNFSIALADDDRTTAAALLREAGIEEGSPCIVLVPGTRWETKLWPAENFGELAKVLHDRHGIGSVLVGGPSDFELGRIAEAASGGAHLAGAASGSAPIANAASGVAPPTNSSEGCVAKNLCGRTTLRQLAAIIERAAVVITADSTPMHMAACFNRPLVALFGPTSPVRTGPYARLDDIVRVDLPCAPCYYRKLSQCPHDHACMRDLTVSQAADAASERLSVPS